MQELDITEGTPIAEGETHVWWMRQDEQVARIVQGCVRLLAADEQSAYSRYRFHWKKLEFAAGRVLAKTVLGTYLRTAPPLVRFRKSSYGKPFIEYPKANLYFNISHSGGLVMCAVSRAPVGVDVERADTERFQLMSEVFTPPEMEWVEKPPATETSLSAFYVLWTRKEAVLKAKGIGFSLPATSVVVPLGREAARTRGHTLFTFEPASGYLAAVATADDPDPPTSHVVCELQPRMLANAADEMWSG